MRKVILFLSISMVGCQPVPLTSVKCMIDSVSKKQPISVSDGITPTWMYHTNCGNSFSLYQQTYKIGDSLVFLIKPK
jgi:hypothetical protein